MAVKKTKKTAKKVVKKATKKTYRRTVAKKVVQAAPLELSPYERFTEQLVNATGMRYYGGSIILPQSEGRFTFVPRKKELSFNNYVSVVAIGISRTHPTSGGAASEILFDDVMVDSITQIGPSLWSMLCVHSPVEYHVGLYLVSPLPTTETTHG